MSTTIKALVIRSAEWKLVDLDRREWFAAVQEEAGGFVQAVTGDGWVLWCNEDGKAERLPINEGATLLANALLPGFANRDFLVGNVIFLGDRPDGAPSDVPDELVRIWTTRILEDE